MIDFVVSLEGLPVAAESPDIYKSIYPTFLEEILSPGRILKQF